MAASVRIAGIQAATADVGNTITSRSAAGAASVRIAEITAQTSSSIAQVRLAGISARTSSGSSASVRIAEISADAPSATYIWDGSSWLLSAPPGTGLGQAHAVSGGTGTTATGPNSPSVAFVRSDGSRSNSSGAGTLALTGGGTLLVSGGAIGATGKVGEIDFTGSGPLKLVGNAAQGPAGFGSVSVFVDALNDPPRILLDLTGFLGATATITRIDAVGNRSPVRLGSPATLDAGTWVGYDYEAPYGQAVRYEAAATLTVTSDPVTLPIATAWFVHPGIPDLSMSIQVSARGDRTHAANQGVFKVIGRAAALTRSDGVRSTPAYDLTLGTHTVQERSALGALLGDCTTLLLQIPADDIYQWVSIGDVTESDLVPVFDSKVQHWTLPCTVTDPPEGLLQAQRTLADLAAEFSTLQDVSLNYASLRDVAVDNLIGS